MLDRNIELIKASHLHALVEAGVPESRSLEFKQALNIKEGSETKEFLADVSSFANADGGDIIFGIKEKKGVAVEVVGLELGDPERTLLSVENLVRDGIQPRIVGLKPRCIELDNGRYALLLRIPSSMNRPHMVAYRGSSRFYSRTSAGKYQLDVQEIRTAFIASDSLSQRVRQLRLERIDSILQGRTPVPLSGSHLVCFHAVPLQAFNSSFEVDISDERTRKNLPERIDNKRLNWGINFDGLIASSVNTGNALVSYMQVLRNGVIEAANSNLLGDGVYNGIPRLSISNIARCISSTLADCFTYFKDISVPCPVIVGVSLLNVKSYHMCDSLGSVNICNRPIDRDHLILSDRLAESYDIDAAEFLRPCFDQVANAVGKPKANYDKV